MNSSFNNRLHIKVFLSSIVFVCFGVEIIFTNAINNNSLVSYNQNYTDHDLTTDNNLIIETKLNNSNDINNKIEYLINPRINNNNNNNDENQSISYKYIKKPNNNTTSSSSSAAILNLIQLLTHINEYNKSDQNTISRITTIDDRQQENILLKNVSLSKKSIYENLIHKNYGDIDKLSQQQQQQQQTENITLNPTDENDLLLELNHLNYQDNNKVFINLQNNSSQNDPIVTPTTIKIATTVEFQELNELEFLDDADDDDDDDDNENEFNNNIIGFVNIVTNADDDNANDDYDIGGGKSDLLPDLNTEYNDDYATSNDNNSDDDKRSCILGTAEFYLSSWMNEDGSLKPSDIVQLRQTALDLSFTPRTVDTLYSSISNIHQRKDYVDIQYLSVAHNNLTIVPNNALQLLNNTLEYLSLAGNDFSKLSFNTDEQRLCNWSNFPLMLKLRELDIRHCRITTITDAFSNLENLEKLFIAHNRIIQLEDKSFTALKYLEHLDISYNDATIEIMAMTGGMSKNDAEYYDDLYNQLNDPYNRLSEGIKIDDFVFRYLENLRFLDFSHSKIMPISTRTFASLASNMELLSLCYTGLPIIPNGMFNGTKLKVLDLSGNPSLAFQLHQDAFNGINETLEILSIQNSNLKPLEFLNELRKLKILQLNTNNINQLSNETFKNLLSIEILDLNSNHISNWYYRIFETNTNLKVLKLRNNNINIMTTEMFKDFAELEYLAIGENSFICNCILREFIDLAAINNREVIYKTVYRDLPNISENIKFSVLYRANNSNNNNDNNNTEIQHSNRSNIDIQIKNLTYSNLYYYIGHKLYYDHIANFPISYRNINKIKERNPIYKMKVYNKKNRNHFKNYRMDIKMTNGIEHKTNIEETPLQCNDDNSTCNIILTARDTLNFTFQLLDFYENDYSCMNSTTNNEYLLTELENCFGDRTWDLSALRRTSNTLTFVLVCLFVAFILFIIIYYKWWYVRYFCIIVKNATILSFLDKNKRTKLKDNLDKDNQYNYDVFVSYCDENREWILEELLPNIERRTEINVCLHERDFQVGISILENIISCMDRSRCLLLVVSQSFLLSQWCQFEMHLAQHRLLETRREHLILILLEDVPKRKRPKTLHYLMRTKTYIKWPIEDKRKKSSRNKENISRHLAEERIIFWKRLRKALMDNDWENENGSPA